MRPCRAARGAKPIACGQSFAPRGVNRMEPDPSSAMRHAAPKHMSRRCAWPPARTPRTRRTAETASRASSSALVCSPKRCDDVCSHGAARARRSCREAWSRVAHSHMQFYVVVRPSIEWLPSLRISDSVASASDSDATSADEVPSNHINGSQPSPNQGEVVGSHAGD